MFVENALMYNYEHQLYVHVYVHNKSLSVSLSLLLSPLQVVSEGCSEDVQCHVLSLLHEVTSHSIMATMEFEQIGGMQLIQQVLQKPQAAVGEKILDVSTTIQSTLSFNIPPIYNIMEG